MIVLRDYQKDLVDKINKSTSKRNCIQLATGGGKTVIFSYLAQNFKGRVLILVNREELLEQTSSLFNEGYDLGFIKAGVNQIPINKVVIAMVETLDRRLKKGLININDFDLIIVDEIQNTQFVKCFDGYVNRLLGFTATPVTDKKERYSLCGVCGKRHEKVTTCCEEETLKANKKISLSRWYGELITGIKISELIEQCRLTPVREYVCDTPNIEKLKTDASGGFTSKSESEVFDDFVSIENLVINYERHSKGLKTMIFNSTINSNNLAYEELLKRGYNVKSYDSKSKESRVKIVDWFRNTPDGILMSVGVFTTGFDVDDVQSIIMNRATKSLSLYHQIVGRGGRITDKIYKPYFKLIDLGGNVDRFNSWDFNLNWEKIYYDEKEKVVIPNEQICPECGAFNDNYFYLEPCYECGYEEEKPDPKVKETKTLIARERKPLPKPNPIIILNYALKNDLDINEAKVKTADYLVEMFKAAKTPKEVYTKNIKTVRNRVNELITPIYFALHSSELKGNKNRTITDFINKVIKKIDSYYENTRG